MYEYPSPDLLLSHCYTLDWSTPAQSTVMAPRLSDQFPSHADASIGDALVALNKSEPLRYNGYDSHVSLPFLPSHLQRPTAIQRSVSSHALQKDTFRPPFPSCHDSLRRVFSTGDLQIIHSLQHGRRSESPLGQENCSFESITKVGRYSIEERRERIERYRSKRNQRNFHKKIKYACRKTLADSRPRIRGRFARNEETGESSQGQWGPPGGDDDEDDDDAWINFLDAFSMNLIP